MQAYERGSKEHLWYIYSVTSQDGHPLGNEKMVVLQRWPSYRGDFYQGSLKDLYIWGMKKCPSYRGGRLKGWPS